MPHIHWKIKSSSSTLFFQLFFFFMKSSSSTREPSHQSGEDWGEGGQKLAVFSHSFLLHTLKWRQPLAGAWQVLFHLPRFSPGLLCKRQILKAGNPLFWQLFTGLDLQI